MDAKQAVLILESFQQTLESPSTTTQEYESILGQLGSVLQFSAQSQEFREICSIEEIWNTIRSILTTNISTGDVTMVSYILRSMRGVILFGRNISSFNQDIPWRLNIQSALFQNIKSFASRTVPSEFFNKVVSSALQLLANITNSSPESMEKFHLINDIYDLIIANKSMVSDKEILIPLLMVLNNLFKSSDVLYDLLKQEKGNNVTNFLNNELAEVDTDSEIPDTGLILISIFQKIVSHESYLKFLQKLTERELIRYLETSQIIVTSKEDWDNYQIISLLAWIYNFFTIFSAQSIHLLASKVYDEEILNNTHSKLVPILDCLSDLSKYETAKQFLSSYNAMDEIIKLLGIVHLNASEKTIKSEKSDPTKKDFPQVKSLLIEIISFLVYDSFEMQEKVRELNGLEVILSSCKIDDNNPFIKERSIICLKFLLKNNMGNQQFVSQLEAQEPVHNESLREAGYEVEIVEGKVKLKETDEMKAKKAKLNKVETID